MGCRSVTLTPPHNRRLTWTAMLGGRCACKPCSSDSSQVASRRPSTHGRGAQGLPQGTFLVTEQRLAHALLGDVRRQRQASGRFCTSLPGNGRCDCCPSSNWTHTGGKHRNSPLNPRTRQGRRDARGAAEAAQSKRHSHRGNSSSSKVWTLETHETTPKQSPAGGGLTER